MRHLVVLSSISLLPWSACSHLAVSVPQLRSPFMRFPVVLPFRRAFQCLADSNSLTVKFSQQQFGDLHGVFCVLRLDARR
jgi:hypothetical protein